MKNTIPENELLRYKELLLKRANLLGKLLSLRNQFLVKQSEIFLKDDVFAGLKTYKDREMFLEVINRDILIKYNETRIELFKINAEIAYLEMYFSLLIGKPLKDLVGEEDVNLKS
ncbi:MAG: hypothetical protein QXL51_00135 [Candidatus Aenigmatarchaeota archaeon]